MRTLAPKVQCAPFPRHRHPVQGQGLLEQNLNTDPTDPLYVVAFNLVPNTPHWLQAIHAFRCIWAWIARWRHFLIRSIPRRSSTSARGLQASARSELRDKDIRYSGINRNGDTIEISFRDQDTLNKARSILTPQLTEMTIQVAPPVAGSDPMLTASLAGSAQADRRQRRHANITTLSKRVNELGVSEPIIHARVRTASWCRCRACKTSRAPRTSSAVRRRWKCAWWTSRSPAARKLLRHPFGSELFKVGKNAPVVLFDPVLTGDYISSAAVSFDQNQQPAVSIDLNGDGGRKMRDATRSKVGKSMAIVLFEKGKGEVLTVATIQSELGSRFQITGMGSPEAAADLALLLRAGALPAPLTIIEERTIGPQLGAENIKKGFDSTMYGFAVIAAFMIIYYMLFGFSACWRCRSTCCC